MTRPGWVALGVFALASLAAGSQSPGGGATVTGIVVDPTGAAIPSANVAVVNRVTGYSRSVVTNQSGGFQFAGVPPNSYHLEVTAPGFNTLDHHIDVRSSVPLSLKLPLEVAGGTTSVSVEGYGADLVENVPYAHHDVDQGGLARLPVGSPGSSLSDVITLSAPGIVADSNGFFHPLGDHAQVTFSIDGQPISDQQSKQFSTQMPANALQSMELISGAPPVEFGDKTGLVVNAMTRSGLAQKPFGSIAASYGSFGTVSEESSFGLGNSRLGNFVAANALRSGRFLDTPEFNPMHAVGNDQTFFDRFDYQPNGKDAFHLNVFIARNWFQVPNTYDQPNQDQRQKVVTFNFAPSYQRTFGASTLVSVNPFVRRDHVSYYPSGDPFFDTPATIDQERRLTNWGTRIDLSHVHGGHNLKFGTQIMQTRLRENFGLGLTDPNFNAVCVDASGAAQALPGVTDPNACPALGFAANPELQPGLVAHDLTRGGAPFRVNDAGAVNQFAFYAQDSITWGHLNVTPGIRMDRYSGLSKATGVQPRVGISYHIHATGTVLRAAYSRTFETPYNENLLLSSATGAGGLAASGLGAREAQSLRPGNRNQYNVGFQQGFGRALMVEGDYFWKVTRNAFDFDTLFDTPIAFPISWRKSKIDGFTLRIGTPDLHGFQAFTTLGHTRARFFGPENGGLIFNSPVDVPVFRVDHDQAFQQTTNLRYQFPKAGPWFTFVWRYDSGMVAGAVGSLEDALGLTAAQQTAIGFHCGGQTASLSNPITACASPDYGAALIRIPAPGTANEDHNPTRISPRNLFDVGAGTDNLFHKEHVRTSLKLMVLNVTNNVALYNFLSTFSGTHFVAPRTYQASIGVAF